MGDADSRFGRNCPQMLGGMVKKDVGGAKSRFGRKCPQMLGGRVKKTWERPTVNLGGSVLKCWEGW